MASAIEGDDSEWISCDDGKGGTFLYNPNTCEVRQPSPPTETPLASAEGMITDERIPPTQVAVSVRIASVIDKKDDDDDDDLNDDEFLAQVQQLVAIKNNDNVASLAPVVITTQPTSSVNTPSTNIVDAINHDRPDNAPRSGPTARAPSLVSEEHNEPSLQTSNSLDSLENPPTAVHDDGDDDLKPERSRSPVSTRLSPEANDGTDDDIASTAALLDAPPPGPRRKSLKKAKHGKAKARKGRAKKPTKAPDSDNSIKLPPMVTPAKPKLKSVTPTDKKPDSVMLSWELIPAMETVELPPLGQSQVATPNPTFPEVPSDHPMLALLQVRFREKDKVQEWLHKKAQQAKKAKKAALVDQASPQKEKEERQARSDEQYHTWVAHKKKQQRREKAAARLKKKHELAERTKRLEAQEVEIQQIQQKIRDRHDDSAPKKGSHQPPRPHKKQVPSVLGILRKRQERDLADTLQRLEQVELVLAQVADRSKKKTKKRSKTTAPLVN
ncbi:Aste57867_24366 [Aphanomyces stellatus]|uniref:Aste57867_24366 protein n=1 Tax=Aphanomyces stellatus TaxID=120398 RepID=A0A485LQB5_9STRA|nr:hypothetical protein As57867_024290 [Aphanomyces stellatus]VFU01006.1 Aste57867_24366 [Aphanomyces stellatus]